MPCSTFRSVRTVALLVVGLSTLAACAPRTRPDGGGPAPAGDRAARGRGAFDPVAVYANAGLIAEADPIQFVGNLQYLAGPTPDTTLVLLTLSMPNRDFTFVSEGDGYRARYQVAVQLRRGAEVVRQVEARETVRVSSFRESTRGDESIVFQQYVAVPPGQYVVAISVRDEGSARNGTHEMVIAVPPLASPALSTPVPVYEAERRLTSDSVPGLIANPRATAVFGRDSVLRFYLEGYGVAGGVPVTLTATSDTKGVVWQDTLALDAGDPALRAAVVSVPVAELGVGRLTMTATAGGTRDTVRAPLFVTFGEQWAVSSFEDMLVLLRFFASDARLQKLRDATGRERATAWHTFYTDTDPDPRTTEHEALDAYFTRIRIANERFDDDVGQGWQSDRGQVYVTLGEPDQVVEQGDNTFSQRGRAQIWTYHQHRLQLVFIDQSGFGRWRMTTSSESDFQMAAARVRK